MSAFTMWLCYYKQCYSIHEYVRMCSLSVHYRGILLKSVDVHQWQCRRHLLKKLVPETGTRNFPEKFDASSPQFFAPKQLSSQSHCTVRVTCQTVSVLEHSCVLLRAINLTRKSCTRLTDTLASFWYQTTCTSLLSMCRWHKSKSYFTTHKNCSLSV